MVLKLDFAELIFYDKYVICHINHGETVNKDRVLELRNVGLDYYKDKPFVYVTHRINSYSVDPNAYKETLSIKTLIGFIFVSDNLSYLKSAHFEKMFLNKPMGIFKNIDEAMPWILKRHEEYSNLKN